MKTSSGSLLLALPLALSACGGGGDGGPGGAAGAPVDTGSLTAGDAQPAAGVPLAERSLADRPDDRAGPQVHVVYATSRDGPDEQLDTRGDIQESLFAVNRWLGRATGLSVRLDTFRGALDVQFVRLPGRAGDYFAAGRDARRRIEQDLREAGLVDGAKLYLVYYAGAYDRACGDAPNAGPPARGEHVAVVYLHAFVPGRGGCDANPMAASAAATPRYIDYVALHEIFHLLGAVDARAPHAAARSHVGDDPCDLMYAGPDTRCWDGPKTIDVDGRDYFNPLGLATGLANVAQSPFLGEAGVSSSAGAASRSREP